MYRDIAHAVYKRGQDHVEGYELPSWTWALVLANIVVFLPVMMMMNYTFQNIFPVLAMVEDPSPPAYEPVSLNDDTQSFVEDAAPKIANETGRRSMNDTLAVTSSFRATFRAIRSIGGWISMFRGFACFLAMSVGSMFVALTLSTFLPAIIAAPIGGVMFLQLYTTWVHIVISAPSAKSFWQRVPPLKTTFKATALPIALTFVAWEFSHKLVPGLLANVLGLNRWDSNNPGTVPEADASDIWKAMVVFITAIVLKVFVTIPAQVVLARVQASLLPEEDETIIPFDRSFQGKLEPAIVGGKGYVTIKDAWATFSRASWIRLVKMYVKIFAVGVAVGFVWMAVLIPQVVLVLRYTKKVD